MNGLLVGVLVVLAIGLALGYHRGLIMSVYALASWIVTLVIVSCAAPIISAAIISNTDIDERIESQTVSRLESMVRQRGDDTEKKSSDTSAGEELSGLGYQVPPSIMDALSDTSGLTDAALTNLGIYELIARNISHMIIRGVTFAVVLFIMRIVVFVVGRTLKFVSELKGIRQANKLAGAALGGLEALVIVWIAFALIAFASTTDFGKTVVPAIEANLFLRMIYEHNPILTLALGFL